VVGLPLTPLGELTALPQTPRLGLRGPTSKATTSKWREEDGRGRDEREVGAKIIHATGCQKPSHRL